MTFHQGCATEFNAVAETLGIEVETWFIPSLPPLFFDGASHGNALYNIGHDRAERIWNLHKETFEQFDAVITSDTAPLSRIFLQNNFSKPLIIWICNRFDYSDRASLDCVFPDPEYYRLFKGACKKKNVRVVAYNLFEKEYARRKGIDIGDWLITPCAPKENLESFISSIPNEVDKKEAFFLPPYTNDMTFSNKCNQLGIPIYRGRYTGAEDLKDFKAIIHFPYAWSNLAFFENISMGTPYLIPSVSFLKTLLKDSQYWFVDRGYLGFEFTEWYMPGREEVITYFDSWEDLQHKIQTMDFISLRKRIKKYAESYRANMLDRWTELFRGFYE